MGSRRYCDLIIGQGRVKVNGVTTTDFSSQVGEKDTLMVDQKLLPPKEPYVLYAFHKPIGVVCSTRSRDKKVLDYFPQHTHLFTVGRLDKRSDGLLLVTNHGTLAQKIAHPRYGVIKSYLVHTGQAITEKHCTILRHGCCVEGTKVVPHTVTPITTHKVLIAVGEGKKHEVRHLIQHCGLQTVLLRRIAIGLYFLGKKQSGSAILVPTTYHNTFFAFNPEQVTSHAQQLYGK